VSTLTVGFLLSGDSLATDRGEIPGSILSASFATLTPALRDGVCGVHGVVKSNSRGRRFWNPEVSLTVSTGEGSGVNTVGGSGVVGLPTDIEVEIGPVETGEGLLGTPKAGAAVGKRP
jgi:hypothetical protein